METKIIILIALAIAAYRGMIRLATSSLIDKIGYETIPGVQPTASPYDDPERFGLMDRYMKMGPEKYEQFLDRVNRRFMPENKMMPLCLNSLSDADYQLHHKTRIDNFYRAIAKGDKAGGFPGDNGWGWFPALLLMSFVIVVLWATGAVLIGTMGRAAMSHLGISVYDVGRPSTASHLMPIVFWVAMPTLSLITLYGYLVPIYKPKWPEPGTGKDWTGIACALNHFRAYENPAYKYDPVADNIDCFNSTYGSEDEYFIRNDDPREILCQLGPTAFGYKDWWTPACSMLGIGFSWIAATTTILWVLIPVKYILDLF